MERAKRKTVVSAFMTFLALSLWSSCTTEDQLHSQTSASVEATFRLKSNAAMNGRITIREGYLKLDRIQATGNLGGNNNTDITHPVPPEEPPFQLSKADSNKINFTLPFRIYDRLDFHLFLFQDNYDLIYQETPAAEIPDPVEDGDDHSSDDEDEAGNNDKGDENDDDDDEGDDSDDSESEEDDDDDDDDDGDDRDDDDDEKDDKKKKDNDKKNEDKDGDDDDDDNDDEDEDDEDDDDEGDGRTGKTGRMVVNLADFFQNAKPGMVLMGTYENNGTVITIVFVATGIEQIIIPARQNDSFSIILDEENSAAITFDPEVLFDGITPGQIESAQIQTYQQQQVLFIHREFNSELFQVLAPRLEQSAGLNVEVSNL